jgi:hypothetical protein
VPSCSISVYDRPIEALHGINLPGARHGFIDFTDSSGDIFIGEGQKWGRFLGAYFGDLGPSSSLPGSLPLDNPSVDHLDGTDSGPQVCSWEAILAADAANVDSQSIRYHWWGPNSSSVLRYMLESLPDTAWFTMPWMIGFGALLPGIEKP